MKRRYRWIAAVATLFGLLVLACLVKAIFWPAGRITISKETTYLTEPVRADGYIDYVAGLNQICSKGVTPENNASVLFWKALGPKEIDALARPRFFEMLGIAPLPEAGDYFVPSDEVHERINAEANAKAKAGLPTTPESAESTELPESPARMPDEAESDSGPDTFEAAMTRPWSREECPALAEWLDRNEKPLALVVEGTQRSRRYEPLYCSGGEDGLFLAGSLPGSKQSREFARALTMRAMLRLKENRVDDAWADLLSCHRLARLVGQGPTLVDLVVAIANDGMACRADQAMLRHAHLSAEQLAKMRADVAQLPPMTKMADKTDLAERLAYLDAVSHLAKHGLGSIEVITTRGMTPPSSSVSIIGSVIGSMVNWNIVLRQGNAWYDRCAAALREPTREERTKALKSIESDLRSLTSYSGRWPSLLGSAIFSPRRTSSKEVSQSLLSLLLPTVSGACNIEDCWATWFELNKLAFALAAYRVDHGAYPEKLADLVPKYVAELPKDIFNDAELHYQRDGDGYLMYSVGRNGVDDGGKSVEDLSKDEHAGDWDDETVRMPATGETAGTPAQY